MIQQRKKRYAVITADLCVACGSCEDVCPREAVRVVKGSFAAADRQKCIGCGQCERVCPAGAIVLEVGA